MWRALALVLVLVGCGNKPEFPKAFRDVAGVAAKGKVMRPIETGAMVEHKTLNGFEAVFADYAAALEGKGWARTKDNPKPNLRVHNGCFARGDNLVFVGVSQQDEAKVAVLLTTGCVGML